MIRKKKGIIHSKMKRSLTRNFQIRREPQPRVGTGRSFSDIESAQEGGRNHPEDSGDWMHEAVKSSEGNPTQFVLPFSMQPGEKVFTPIQTRLDSAPSIGK